MRAIAIRDTSLIAYDRLRASAKLSRQQLAVTAFLAGILRRDCTRAELAEMLEMRLSSVCGRVNELRELGVIEELPRRRCRVTGESAHPVRLAPVRRELFRERSPP